MEFKEEILKNVHDFEEDLLKKINTKMIELNTDYKKFHKNLNNLAENNKQLITSLITKNVNAEKISSLEKFRNKVDSILITHEIRINNNIEQINSIKAKYDKAIMENLMVPGYVGPSCQFKNIGEFIIYNISEVAKIKSEKDLMKNSFRDLKVKTDSSMRTVLNLNDSLVRRSNDYTDSKISEFKKLIYEKIDYMNTKEKEIKGIFAKFGKDRENFEKERKNFGNELKEEILSEIDIKINEAKKNQEEIIFKAVNENNNFLENYVKQIFDSKIKVIQDDILDIQDKIKNLNIEKEISNNKIIQELQNKINEKEKNQLPIMPSLSQKGVTFLKSNSNNYEEKKINNNESIDNSKQNKTYSNNSIIKELNENYKQTKTLSNFSKKNKPIIKDLHLKNDKVISEPILLSNKISQKNEINNILNELEKNYKEIHKTNYIDTKSEDNIPIIYNNDKESSDINIKNRNSKILIFKYDQKSHNSKLISKSKINSKEPTNNDEFMKNFVNIKTLKNENFNNKDSDLIDCAAGEEKSLRNIIDNLQTPKILEDKILSIREIKMKHSRSNHLNNKKFEFKFKTLENLKKNSKNWKSDRNIKSNKDRRSGFNFVKLKLLSENNLINGAAVIASKKMMNKHITKIDYPNSFESLYNVQIKKKNPVNN